MGELKDCPFCGGEASHIKSHGGHKVQCIGRLALCTMNMRTHYFASYDAAVGAWNTRTNLIQQWQPIDTITTGDGHVLFFGSTYHDINVVFSGWIGTGGYTYSDNSPSTCIPTHWMPLPPPPDTKDQST